MNTEMQPLYLGQCSYSANLIDRTQSRIVRNPSRADARPFSKEHAIWHIIEATAVFDLGNQLVWHERAVGHYHYRSISRRRMNKLILSLNIKGLNQYFYKYTTVNGTIVGQHKERRLLPSPMSNKKLKPIIEERVIDYFTMPAPIDLAQLRKRQRGLEQNIENYHLLRKKEAQQSYYRSLRSSTIDPEELSTIAELLGEGEIEHPARPPIANKAERAARAINAIGQLVR